MKISILAFMLLLCVCCASLSAGQRKSNLKGKSNQPCSDEVLVVRRPYEKSLPECLRKLQNAESFDGSAIGIGGERSHNYQLYEQALLFDSITQVDLRCLLKNASPAGRLYAAILISKLNWDDGCSALKLLTNDQSPVKYDFGGCVIFTDTVGKVAQLILHAPKTVDCSFESKPPKEMQRKLSSMDKDPFLILMGMTQYRKMVSFTGKWSNVGKNAPLLYLSEDNRIAIHIGRPLEFNVGRPVELSGEKILRNIEEGKLVRVTGILSRYVLPSHQVPSGEWSYYLDVIKIERLN